jgi:hypothetical protein
MESVECITYRLVFMLTQMRGASEYHIRNYRWGYVNEYFVHRLECYGVAKVKM